VALLLYLAQNTGQGFAVAALLLVGDFAPSLLAPLTGGISDRFDRRRVMIGCELAQAAAVLVIAASLPSLPVLLTLVAARAVAAQIFQPASRSAIPALVPDRQLESANSALGFGSNGMEALGPLVAAALLRLIGIRGVLLVDVATFAVSALLLGFLPGPRWLCSTAGSGSGWWWVTRCLPVGPDASHRSPC
jgi:MFS family permease